MDTWTPKTGLVWFALALMACSSSSSSGGAAAPRTSPDGQLLVDGFDPPPPPSDAMQITTPAVKAFPAGGNKEFCYYSKVTLDKPLTFRAGQGFQSKGGHHAVVYWTTQVRPEQMHECTEDDMVSSHVLTGGGAEAGNGVINNLPAGGAFHVPAGAQLMVNMHLLNAGAEAVDAQATVNVFYGDPGLLPLTSFYVTGTDIDIPAHETKTYAASCVVKKELRVTRILGHMHEWGTRHTVTISRPGQPDNVVYDKPGAQDFSYNPPYIDYPTSQPLVISPGDKITATCTWTNTLDRALAFPDEMCATFGYVLGTDPEAGCADGSWNN